MQNKLLKILIPAVGGQGGGILTEWLLKSLESENYNVQSISLPGLAQRGGSTTYYLEACPLGENIIFSQFPMPGDIDLIIAQEFLELGRMLERGYGSENTNIISSTHRMYSTQEKLAVASGVYEEEKLFEFADKFSGKFIGVNVLNLAKKNNMNELASNAILLGALAASGSLPIDKDSFTEAIRSVAVSVNDNLKAFDIGFNYVTDLPVNSDLNEDQTKVPFDEVNYISTTDVEKIRELKKELLKEYPLHLEPFIEEALCRLTDFQNFGYAEKFVSMIKKIHPIETAYPEMDFKLSEYVIKNLALLMSYEDGIRVSQLKVRDMRFERIRKDMHIRDDQVFEVIDYLKPEADEIYGILPDILVRPVLSFISAITRGCKGKPVTVTQKPVTTSFLGYLRIWLLSKLKFMRPVSYRYRNEHATIGLYLETVEKYAKVDYQLGIDIAKTGSFIKGYGRVRRRTVDSFNRLILNILETTYEKEKSSPEGLEKTIRIFKSSSAVVAQEVDGIEKAEADGGSN